MVSSVEKPQSLHCQNLGSPANLKKKKKHLERGEDLVVMQFGEKITMTGKEKVIVRWVFSQKMHG